MNTNVRDIPADHAKALGELAKQGKRSRNAEILVAIEKHVTEQKEQK